VTPAVSVIIPTRNRVNYLREAVASALAQLHVPLEVVIVNDGTDGMPAFEDSRVRILENAERGAVQARNLGVGDARAPIIAFLDDDDWWPERRHLQRAAEALQGKADLVFADGTLRYASGAPDLPFAFDADASSLTRDNTILISAVCYNRALHDALGAFDESLPFYWDWDWYLRVARSGAGLHRIAMPTVMIRVHDGNMSGKDTTLVRRANLDAFEAKHGLAPIPLKNHELIARESSLNN
jgi:glycosyltransferase involved in cell wall biosynthesis